VLFASNKTYQYVSFNLYSVVDIVFIYVVDIVFILFSTHGCEYFATFFSTDICHVLCDKCLTFHTIFNLFLTRGCEYFATF